jgi:hypothetical protein
LIPIRKSVEHVQLGRAARRGDRRDRAGDDRHDHEGDERRDRQLEREAVA